MAGEAIAERELTLGDFDYDLPGELIAQQPLPDRAASRLLHVTRDALTDLHFGDLVGLIGAGDLLVFNDTRVIKARLFGRKPSGGRVELLIERIVAPRRALSLVRTSHSPRIGQEFLFGDALGDELGNERGGELGQARGDERGDRAPARARVMGREADFTVLEFDVDILPLLERCGHVPLPPYILHGDSSVDEQRYQTVYARHPGAVAAPTAGLHFTDELLQRLRERGVHTAHVTLHVGAGTFQPVRVERLSDHAMHREWYSVPEHTAQAVNAAHAEGRRVTAVGTTTLRALESAGADGRVRASAGDTALFITPGYRFQAVDRLITNFHLPKSTLLMLVSAFAGMERIRAAYAHAVTARYRFFSYGDAMLLERAR
jgi:S-adenosylmethionine:tRNA ribosyltransferase-isomerase